MFVYVCMTRADHPGLVSRVFDAVQSKYLSFGMDMQEMYDAYADAYEGAFRDLDEDERDAKIQEARICKHRFGSFLTVSGEK